MTNLIESSRPHTQVSPFRGIVLKSKVNLDRSDPTSGSIKKTIQTRDVAGIQRDSHGSLTAPRHRKNAHKSSSSARRQAIWFLCVLVIVSGVRLDYTKGVANLYVVDVIDAVLNLQWIGLERNCTKCLVWEIKHRKLSSIFTVYSVTQCEFASEPCVVTPDTICNEPKSIVADVIESLFTHHSAKHT